MSLKSPNISAKIDRKIKKELKARAAITGQTPDSYARAVLYGHLFPQETLNQFYGV